MHAKFKSQSFKKGDKGHRSFDFFGLFLLGHLLIQVTWWFLAADGSEI